MADYESMRRALICNASPLWISAPLSAATLAASMPSGDAKVVAIRERLSALSFSTALFPPFASLPTVQHDMEQAMGLPMNSVYVGSGSARRLPSPWLDPSRLPGASCGTFLSYAGARMDLKFWLRLLSGKILI